MARFNLVNEVDCTFDRYGHCGVSCSMLLFVKYSTWSEYSLRWLWALVGIHVGWPNTAASDGLS